jgi:hypothetical protein
VNVSKVGGCSKGLESLGGLGRILIILIQPKLKEIEPTKPI